MKNYDRLFLLFLFLILFILRFFNIPDNIFNWDAFGYYLYLPAFFICNDIKLLNHEWLNEIITQYETTATLYQAYQVETGNWLIRYTMGTSILIAPFFLIAHAVALLTNYPADGFSVPYQIIIATGGLLYACLGLAFLWKILIRFFDRKISILSLIVIFFGTNYPQLILDGTLLTHNFLFTLYAILIYFTIQWHSKPTFLNILTIGLSIGLIVAVRPTEGVCILIPLLWNTFDRASVKQKMYLVKNNLYQIIVGVAVSLLCVVPQLIYWKVITGNLVIDSYNYAGEGLDFLTPHTVDFLFSFRKGWLVYTPVMIFSLAGLYFLYKENRKLFLAVVLFLIIDLYIISSWTTWWYAGGSYSQRAIVPAYVLLAIPLGYFLKHLFTLGNNIRFAYFIIGGFFILLNLFQWWQFANGIITKESMTREYYFAVFGKTKVKEEDKKLLLVKRGTGPEELFVDEEGYTSKIIFYDDFNGEANFSDSSGILILDGNNPFSPGPHVSFEQLTTTDHAWIRIETNIFIPGNFEGELPVLVSSFHHKGKPYKYKGKGLQHTEIIYDGWNKVTLDYLTPEVRSVKDDLKVYIWHRSEEKLFIDYLKVTAFEKPTVKF